MGASMDEEFTRLDGLLEVATSLSSCKTLAVTMKNSEKLIIGFKVKEFATLKGKTRKHIAQMRRTVASGAGGATVFGLIIEATPR